MLFAYLLNVGACGPRRFLQMSENYDKNKINIGEGKTFPPLKKCCYRARTSS